jgi:hypothetical protein
MAKPGTPSVFCRRLSLGTYAFGKLGLFDSINTNVKVSQQTVRTRNVKQNHRLHSDVILCAIVEFRNRCKEDSKLRLRWGEILLPYSLVPEV